MIVTVTMNPAIDKTTEVDCLVRGGLNRIKKAVYDAGGKGINVSKTIKALGGESLATGFLGGNSGRTIANVLDKIGIDSDFIWIEGETRTNTKVFEDSGMLTELNEQGPFIPEEKIAELFKKLEGLADENTIFVLSGSVPPGVDKDIYARITEMAHSRKAAVLVDADGELFKNAVEQTPDIVKPNIAELKEYAGISNVSERELMAAAEGLTEKGIRTVALSMGEKGAIILMNDKKAVCPALSVRAYSTVGAGDAMAAALAYAYENKFSYEDTLKMCMAASAGAVTTTGTKPPEKELVYRLMKQVEIINI